MRQIIYPTICLLLLLQMVSSMAQQPVSSFDSIPVKKGTSRLKSAEDSVRKKHIPRKATIRSAIIPGWGQVYNKKYWKVPIIYGALGTAAGIFIFNLNNYQDTRFAYKVKYNMRVLHDSTGFNEIRPELQPLSEESLRFYRNEFRRDIDYSAIFFIVLWGLNIVDATVDAHLKGFDVSPDLSLKIKPQYNPFVNSSGISLVLNF